MTADKDIFSRWSDRRRAVADAEEVEEPPVEEEAPLQEPQSDEEISAWLVENELPEPESLGLGDDFKGFMKAGVPAILKKRALRQLWLSNPVLANLDGLNDYDGDLRDIAESAAGITTDYEVGRGFMKRVAEVLGADEDAPDVVADDVSGEEAPLEVVEDAPDPVEPEPVAEAAPLPVSDAPTRSRMAFHFDE